MADVDGQPRPAGREVMSDQDFLVLHTLRCIGFVTEGRLAAVSGLSPEETAGRLAGLVEQDLVSSTPGPFGGWALTDRGRVTSEAMLGDELERTDASDQIRRGYEGFLRLNPTLLQICTDRQMVRVGDTHVVNEHLDRGYDTRVLDRLVRIDKGAQRICSDLTAALSRFAPYGTRLGDALDRALAGDASYVTDDFDAYHTVWFQLHEDLLATLGISREEERNSSGPSPG